MQCDVRNLHQDDVLPLWMKVRKYLRLADVSCDRADNEWFLSMRGIGWRFESHARGFRLKDDGTLDCSRATVFLEYYPPNGGRIRFDSHVYFRSHRSQIHEDDTNIVKRPPYWSICPELVQEYGEALVKYGHLGKNRLSYFERTPTPNSKPWWKFWS